MAVPSGEVAASSPTVAGTTDPKPRPPPRQKPCPGLSHISKELVEVSSAQPCEVHFSSDRALVRVSPQDVERDVTQQREVLGSVVFPCSRCVLIEAHIQLPMQLVLDAPMRTHHLKQPLR